MTLAGYSQAMPHAMNVLLVHNFYQRPGGEDQIFAGEGRLLEQHDHVVGRFTMHNDAVDTIGKLTVACKTVWNGQARQSLRKAIRETGARVVHFHNTFPLISPAGYYAAHDEGAAVVQTLHNYRLMCVTATFCRNGGVCEDCLGRTVAWPGILHGCYRGSRAGSAVVAAMLAFHCLKGTWRREVDVYIALSEFGRKKFIEGGLPPDKLVVKPNFLDPAPGIGNGQGDYALFVGRLSIEKGIATMLEAWPKVYADTGIKLKIIGDGPLRTSVEAASKNAAGIEYLGWRDMRKEGYVTMGAARALIFPSIWYETQGMTIVESLATGTPILASRLGSRAEIIADGRTGLLFESGNPDDLARQARVFLSGQADRQRMRQAARLEFESRYTAEQNYPLLMRCYETALKNSRLFQI
jgi:glycosyltransferase involved in cell wall biosynthesis